MTKCLLFIPAFCALPVLAGTFTDSTFNLANYSVSVYQSDSSGTATYDQCTSCGNPGQGLQILATLPLSDDLAAIGFVNNTFSYNPATQGTLYSVNASVDKIFTLNQSDTGASNTFRPLIEQDGIFYMAAIPGPLVNGTTTGWNTISQNGLTAADFLQFDFTTGTFGTGTPNFSGDTMLFGIGQLMQFPLTGINFEADYDNLAITLVQTPEPSTFALIALAAGALALRRYLIQRAFL